MEQKTQTLSKDFIFGVITGIAIMSIVGLIYMSDLQPARNEVTSAGQPTPTPSAAQPTAQPTNVDFTITDEDHIRGPKDAEITIVEFSDFQCPFCSRFHPTIDEVMSNNDNVRWVYKHFPLDSIHPYARKAAEASECAAEQGKFWEYADELFARQASFSDAIFGTIATDLGINVSQFNDCLSSGKYAQRVEADYQLGLESGVRGTPGSFINGQPIAGAVPYSQIQSIIDSL